MLPNLASLLQDVDVLFAELRAGIVRVVGVNKLRKPQGARHPRRPPAHDNDISGHLWAFDAVYRFSKNQHESYLPSKNQGRLPLLAMIFRFLDLPTVEIQISPRPIMIPFQLQNRSENLCFAMK